MNTCSYCLNKDLSIVYPVKDYISNEIFVIKKCNKCQLLQTTPKLTTEKLKKYYKGYRESNGKRFWKPIEFFLNTWHVRRIEKIKKIRNSGTILDIGCGRGTELELLQKENWQTYGTEFSADLKHTLESKNIDTFIGDFWLANYNKNFFDVITMWHSLEHIGGILLAFKEIKRILKKGGILVVAVPNFNSWEQTLFCNLWFHLDVPRHLYHFSDDSLSSILETEGFKIISKNYIAPEFDFYSFCQSGVNSIFSNNPNLMYRLLNKDRIKNYQIPLLFIQIILFVMIGFLSLFIVPLSWLFKKGGTVEIVTVKNEP